MIQDTSKKSLKAVEELNIPESQALRVYQAYLTLKSACDRDISEYTGISLTLIPDRRLRLEKRNYLILDTIKINPQTGKYTRYYKPTTKKIIIKQVKDKLEVF